MNASAKKEEAEEEEEAVTGEERAAVRVAGPGLAGTASRRDWRKCSSPAPERTPGSIRREGVMVMEEEG